MKTRSAAQVEEALALSEFEYLFAVSHDLLSLHRAGVVAFHEPDIPEFGPEIIPVPGDTPEAFWLS